MNMVKWLSTDPVVLSSNPDLVGMLGLTEKFQKFSFYIQEMVTQVKTNLGNVENCFSVKSTNAIHLNALFSEIGQVGGIHKSIRQIGLIHVTDDLLH